ncbi:cupin domain-containing protein [Phenylobacterium sp. CCH12-B4]|uniref:cupin domain-containing protein n=2 Tax=unclassified Phenylobacterium TaxID=2640670 RepID=UPI00083ABDC2|nr:cupin domain-containing protein [Phenylobacterium sp. CCH12-B4]
MPAALVMALEHGLLAEGADPSFPSRVYGFRPQATLVVEGPGTAFGFVHSGAATLEGEGQQRVARAGEYFSVVVRDRLVVEGGEGFLALREGFLGLNSVGGPIETRGRLMYIDGCSDTLLISPPMRGEPCFNLLHFPPGIDQTMHTHPTIRAGLVHSGRGLCRTETGVQRLEPGCLFILYPDAPHAFATEADADMLLTVYHPDSDFGPTHAEHPMLNRTYVDGVSARYIDAIRTRKIAVAGSDASD